MSSSKTGDNKREKKLVNNWWIIDIFHSYNTKEKQTIRKAYYTNMSCNRSQTCIFIRNMQRIKEQQTAITYHIPPSIYFCDVYRGIIFAHKQET